MLVDLSRFYFFSRSTAKQIPLPFLFLTHDRMTKFAILLIFFHNQITKFTISSPQLADKFNDFFLMIIKFCVIFFWPIGKSFYLILNWLTKFIFFPHPTEKSWDFFLWKVHKFWDFCNQLTNFRFFFLRAIKNFYWLIDKIYNFF